MGDALPPESLARRCGAEDCYQDRCENVPFASTGGLEKRSEMTSPPWVPAADVPAYLEGYRAAALELFGAEWATCEFSWQPAITLNAPEDADADVITEVRTPPT